MSKRESINKSEMPLRQKTKTVKIDKSYWQEILKDGATAKNALINLEIGPKRIAVKAVRLENGNEVPVTEITEKQALDFMTKLCPSKFLPKRI